MTSIHRASAAFLALALCWVFVAGSTTPVPLLTERVTDQTATLSAQQKATLEQTLQAFEARKGSQIAVLIVPTTEPESIEQYAFRVVEQWKLGRKKVDDGALLLVAKNDRVLRIEVGYGLEGALNDATSKRIISEVIAPYFRQGDFYGGVTAGVDQMIHVIDGELLPEPKGRPVEAAPDIGQYVPIIFLLALVVGGVLRVVLGRLPGAIVTGGAVAVIAWFVAGTALLAIFAGAIALVFTLLSGGMIGPVIGGYRGGLGGGSFSGGGFGGGGGGFGGGGASGSW